MNATLIHRSEAFAEDLPGYGAGDIEDDLADDRRGADTPLALLPWLTLAVALVGGSVMTLLVAPL
ncbi:MAG: hypothetical protein KIS83_03340 [Rubrivivax sp.]|nr:hypothetical protein [Rubrivivax sp.]